MATQLRIADESVTENLIREGASLKHQIQEMTARLREVNGALADHAEYKEGSRTGHLVGAGFRVAVQRKENVTYDQTKLSEVKMFLGEKFDSLFKAEYKPTGKKAIDGFLEHGNAEQVKAVQWAMTVKEGTPQVSYEKLED